VPLLPLSVAAASGDSALYNLVNLTVRLHTAVEFHMPPICSPLVRPGRPAEAAPVISKALEDVLLRFLLCLASWSISCVSSPRSHMGWLYYCILLPGNCNGVVVDGRI
jgi:exosome complex component RRP43